VDGAEGNPFYVEELIKMLIEDGVIERGEERWHAELERLADVRVPPTLTGVLQARLDSLSRGERMLLQRASVVGRLFWDAAVAELEAGDGDRSDLDRDEIAPLLDAVRGRELVFRRERSAFEATEEYIFKHALLRDVTYETVLLKLRRVYHAQVAAWLEAAAGERLGEYLSLIAWHYERAGETAKAADYLRRSGEELFRVGAFRDAIGPFERALGMLPEGDVAGHAALLVRLGRAHCVVGDYPAALQYLEEGLTLACEAGDRQAEVAALNWLGGVARRQARYGEAEQYLERAATLARERDDPAGMALALGILSCQAFDRGNDGEAERYAEDSLTLFRKLGDRDGIADALTTLGGVAWLRGEHDEGKRYFAESLAISREIGNQFGVAIGLNNLGEAACGLGQCEEALRYYEEALAILRELGLPGSETLLNLGRTHAELGEDGIAWEYVREALKGSSASGAVPVALGGVGQVASLRAKAGRYGPAAEMLGLVLGHPALDAENRLHADPILALLREALPADELEAALERGKSLDLEQVVAEILDEC
jgi:tetratricopeptide (TPR) repeat protein